ncbi:MAG: SEC-C motif domain protein, partial [Dehalococcoidia bacterium]|nr:SEC-C motif domain protein [Dehalococcoidia bacterium]
MSTKIGRNDLCPCGSGKKYKRCCLVKDEAERAFDSASPFEIANAVRQNIATFIFQERFRSDFNRALKQFWGSASKALQFPLKDTADNSLFMDWYVHDYRLLDSRKRLIDLFAEEVGDRLPAAARLMLKQLQNPLYGAYEVIEVERGVGSHVRDIFQGHDYRVQDVSTSQQLKKWDIILGRIVIEGQTDCFSGAIQVLGQWDKAKLETFARKSFREYSRQHPDPNWQDFMRDTSHRFVAYVRRLAERPRKIRFTTSDGEELSIAQAFYQVQDRKNAETRLKKHPSLRFVGPDEDEPKSARFDWVGEPVDGFTPVQPKGGKGIVITESSYSVSGERGRTVLGNVSLGDKRLVLSCFSAERLAAGKKLLEDCCSDAINHVADSKESVDRWLKEPKKEASTPRTEKKLPRATERKLLAGLMDKHYQRWLDEPVPALDGQTPRQAVKTKRGRAKVIALLKDFENRDEHRKTQGDVTYDVNKLKSALGLKEQEFLATTPPTLPATKGRAKPYTNQISNVPHPGDAELLGALEALEDPDLSESDREKVLRKAWAKRNRIPELLTRRLIAGAIKIPELALQLLIGFAGEDSPAYLQRIAEEREAPDVIRLVAHQCLGWPDEGENEARSIFLSTIKDAYGSLLELLALTAQNPETSEDMITEVIKYIMVLSPLERLALLKDIAAQPGEQALPLFRSLLHYLSPDVRDVAINFLVDRGDRRDLRALKRLSDFLREPAEQAEMVVTIRNLETSPGKNITRPLFVHPLQAAYLSIIDGVGAQMAIVVRRHQGGSVKFASVLHKDSYGIKDAWGRIIPDPGDVKRVIEELQSGVGTLARVPLEAVQQVLAEAARVNARMGNPIPSAFELWEPLFYDDPVQDAPPEGYPQLDDKPFIGNKSLLEDSPTILDIPDFESWLFDFDEIAP